MNPIVAEAKKSMEKAIEHMKTEFSRLRVGRATASMVEGVKVDAYGSMMTLKECAALAIPDARTITVTPWDRGLFGEIEKGILAANVGLTPVNDGKIIRLNLPPITEDRRKDFVKQIKKFGEDAKVTIRNSRRDAMDGAKKKSDPALSEDELRRFQDELQKVTDQFSGETDKLVEAKSKDVMSI